MTADILTDDRPLSNAERRAAWSTRYLLSGNAMLGSDIFRHTAAAFEREFALATMPDDSDFMHDYTESL